MADTGRTDSQVPIAVSDRAANLLRRREAELERETGREVVVRIEVVTVQKTCFDCEIRFDTQFDGQDDLIFLSSGVRLAVSRTSLDIVRGMEIVYFDGVVNLRQKTCSRTPDIKDFKGTISVHSRRSMYYARESAADREHFHQVQIPAAPPKSAVWEQVERLLDREQGLVCIPRYFRDECRRTLRGESDAFLQKYLEGHLGVLERHIEPLARSGAAGGDEGFHELATMLVDTPNLGTAALTLGLEQPEAADLTMWRQWADEKREDPAVCLYCVGNFLAIPPFAGEMPRAVGGGVCALAAASLAELGRFPSVIALVERFLDLNPEDYFTDESLREALGNSPLANLEPLAVNLMVATLSRSVEAVPERSGDATRLRRVVGQLEP